MVSLLALTGTLALLGGSLGFFAYPAGLAFGLKRALNLAENGLVFPLFMAPPFTINSTFNLFAVTNPRDVLRGKRMQFEVKGPYRFKTTLLRDNIAFKSRGERVAFDSGRQMVPDELESADFDERMWLLNPILPSVLRTVKSMLLDRLPLARLSEPIVFNSVNLLLDNFGERLIMRTTPRLLLMGRRVALLDSITGLAARFGLTALVPPGPPENTFGLAFIQNVTMDPFELWTGTGASRDKFGEVFKWRNRSNLNVWRGQPCNTIAGTNGELFKPLLDPQRPLTIFLGPLCRTVQLVPTPGDNGSVLTGSGIRGQEFEISSRLFLGARSNPKNRCFCENARTYDCQLDGLLAMGPCFFDAPLFFSRGNMVGVDERIKRLIDASVFERRPVSERQAFTLEQTTGTVLEVELTFMALVKVSRQAYMRDLANVQNLTYAPLFAATEGISLPFSGVWQVYGLQKFNDYHKPIMAATAATGFGLLGFKWMFGL